MAARKENGRMRIYAVTPIHVDAGELARRQTRYDALSGDAIRVVLHDVGPDAPRALETAADVRESEARVVDALIAAPAGFDAVLADCVLDPGGPDLRQHSRLPVLGLLRMSLGWHVCAGSRVGAVVRNDAIADELVARVQSYGLDTSFTDVEVLGLGVEAIADGNDWLTAVAVASDRLGAGGAEVVVNGCSAVELPARRTTGPRLVDPTALALRLLSVSEAA